MRSIVDGLWLIDNQNQWMVIVFYIFNQIAFVYWIVWCIVIGGSYVSSYLTVNVKEIFI